MARKQPITIGDKFGRLTVTGEADWYVRQKSGDRHRQWYVRCWCGNEKVVLDANLKNGKTRSCGCLWREAVVAAKTTHGLSGTPEYKIWCGIEDRCHRMASSVFAYYGGVGVGMCDEWRHDPVAFIEYVGPRPSDKHSIDRVENDKGYEPGNVRWATDQEQANNRRNNRLVTAFGLTLTIARWSRRNGIKQSTIRARLRRGWSEERAVR